MTTLTLLPAALPAGLDPSVTRPSLGVLLGLPIAAIAVLAALGVAAWALSEDEGGIALGGVGAAVAVVVATGFFMWPWSSEYHRWTLVHGTVTADPASRLLTSGSGSDATVNQRFVLMIDGQPFGVDDTRAAAVKKGDVVDLSCKREYQFSGESGWACNWGRP